MFATLVFSIAFCRKCLPANRLILCVYREDLLCGAKLGRRAVSPLAAIATACSCCTSRRRERTAVTHFTGDFSFDLPPLPSTSTATLPLQSSPPRQAPEQSTPLSPITEPFRPVTERHQFTSRTQISECVDRGHSVYISRREELWIARARNNV